MQAFVGWLADYLLKRMNFSSSSVISPMMISLANFSNSFESLRMYQNFGTVPH
jgi:hypothetical protein